MGWGKSSKSASLPNLKSNSLTEYRKHAELAKGKNIRQALL
jgi:hypothetical protein